MDFKFSECIWKFASIHSINYFEIEIKLFHKLSEIFEGTLNY